MPHQLSKCTGSGTCTYCAERARLDIACDCSKFGANGLGGKHGEDFLTIPGVIRVAPQVSIQTPPKSRYAGTNRLFISGCGARRELTWNVTAKWFKEEYIIGSLIQHGGCVCLRLVLDPPSDDPTADLTGSHAFLASGKLQQNSTLVFNNNGNEETEISFSLSVDGWHKYVGAKEVKSLVCPTTPTP